MTRPDDSHKPVLTALAAVLLVWPGLASAAWIEGERARLQARDKITARISTLDVRIDTPVTFGTLMPSGSMPVCDTASPRAWTWRAWRGTAGSRTTSPPWRGGALSRELL